MFNLVMLLANCSLIILLLLDLFLDKKMYLAHI